ncbi:MAG: ABC transporter permease [Chloroflexota bacterium]|nr:ABC transporter permease [Chloroflexota bacterium]
MDTLQKLPVVSIDVPLPRRRTPFGQFVRRFTRNRAAVISAIFVLLLAVVAIFAPFIAPYDYDEVNFAAITVTPSAAYLFGTDALGRDVLSRLIYGARVSLFVSLIAQFVIIVVGVPIGILSGFLGGWVDIVIQRIIDVLYAFPSLLFIIIIMTYLQGTLSESDTALAQTLSEVNDATGGLLGVLIALGLVFWLTVSRIVRGEVLSIKEKEFIVAARAIGATNRHLMLRHILPNILAPVLVAIAFGIPNVIMLEAGLSYLGLGTKPPVPSWGLMIAEGVKNFRSFPHLLIAPGLTLAITLLSFNYLGDGIRQALDPSLRND